MRPGAAWRIVLVLAVLVAVRVALPAAALAAPQDPDSQVQAEPQVDALVEELGRALGMTPAEVEALGLSRAEMEGLLAGFTEETVVVGTRARPRSATASAVPVDVLSATDLVRQGAGDLKEQLRTVVPSFNTNTQPIQGASTVVRPAMLRNLAPDHTLVLVNGKRRHRSSVLEWHGGNGVAYGSQGPDISVIPSIALRQVEVLRDGAAAQYGSDAIAGVMNFQLKDAASGGAVELNSGMYGAGDGEGFQVAGNVGLPLGAAGFANLSLEYGSANPTDRTAPRNDALALIAAGNMHVRSEHPQRWGDPDIDDDLKVFGNFGYALPTGVELYAHTNYASKTVTQSFFFRNPNTRLGVFSIDSGRTLLVGDALAAAGRGSANCPAVAVTDHVPDPVALQQVFGRPELLLVPGGLPRRLHAADGRDGDGRVARRRRPRPDFRRLQLGRERLARHALDRPVHLRNTVNASLGPMPRPTSFDVGTNRQRDDQPPLRRVVRRHRDGQHRRRRRMARGAVPDLRAGGPRRVD